MMKPIGRVGAGVVLSGVGPLVGTLSGGQVTRRAYAFTDLESQNSLGGRRDHFPTRE